MQLSSHIYLKLHSNCVAACGSLLFKRNGEPILVKNKLEYVHPSMVAILQAINPSGKLTISEYMALHANSTRK